MSVFQATLVGTPSAIDVKKNSWNTSSKTKFVGTGLQSINIKFVGDSTLYFCYVNKIEIFVGGSLWRTVTFYGGDILWQTCNYYIFKSNKVNPFYGAKDNIDIGLYETKTYISGNPYAMSDAVLGTEPQFTTAGSKSITAKIYYQYHMGEGYPGYGSQLSSWQTETISCGSVSVLNPYCERITLSGGKREFYAPEQFDYSTLVVTGYYRYAADGGLAYTAPVTGYEISNPSYLFSVAQNSQGASGYVTVTYSGRTASYEISVYGVKRYTAPTARSSRNTPYFRLGEQHTLAQSTITYGDDTTETEMPSVSGFSTAAVTAEGQSATATYSIYADKTRKAYSWDEQYKVLPMYLTLDLSNVQRDFDADDDLSASGLVVLAHYGYDNNEERDLAGVDNIPLNDPNLSITFPTKKPGAKRAVTVAYSNGHDQASAAYSININGIYDVDIDISAYKDGLQVEKNGTVSFGLATARVRRYSNGTLSDWVPYSGTIYAKPVDTSAEGKTDITLYVQENGAYAEQAFPLEVYGIADIHAELPTQFYYEGTGYPTINFSKIRAYAKKTTDGSYVELSYNAAANGYEAVIGGVVQTESEIALTEDTLITIRSKADNSIYTEALVRVTEKAAVANAPLIVRGDVQYVSAGEEIDKSRFSVYQQMNDGTVAQITDFDCVISGKSGLTFGAGDAVGQSYDLVFSKSPSASKTVQNAAFLDGVRSIDNVSIAKTVYDIGDQFNASEISCTVNYYHAESRNARFRVGTDTCAKTAFAAADAGEQSIPLTLYGQQAYVQVMVRKVVSLVKVDGESPTYGGYRIHDSLDPSGHGYSFRKVYDHEIDGEDTYDLSDSEVSFAFSGAGAGCSAADLIPSLASQQITVTPSYTENGFTVSCDSYSIYAKRLKSISLIDSNAQQVSKLHMDKGNALDLSPYRLHVEFNNGDVLNIEAQSADSANPANGAIISDAVIGAAIGYTFVRNDSLTATYDIHVHYVSEIQTNLNTAIAASYYTGSVIDLTTITASRVISSTDQEESGYPLTQQFTPRLTLDSMSVEGTFQLSVAGNHTLSFADSGITKSVTFSVVSTALSSIATNRSNVFKSLADYVEGQRLDLTGLSITKSYNDGSTETLSADDPNVQLVDGDGEPVSKRKEIALSDDGMELFVKISENGVTRTAAVEESNGSPVALSVAPNELDSIEILSSSTHKTTFTYGDRFSSDGMMLKATFTNGSTQGVPLQSVSFSGAAIGHEFNPTDDQTFGSKTITISYTYGGITKTATYEITLAKPVLSSITTNAASDSFVSKYVDNEVYSESGLVVTGVFANGWTSVIPSANWLTNAATVLAIDGQTGRIQMTGNYGSKTITVTATNPYDSNQASVTATYNVDVLTSGQIVSATLMFDDDVDYADYFVGDEYDAKGVYFHIADIDGNETNVRSFTTNPAVGTRLRKAQRLEISCTYVKGSFSHTATYSITVSVKDSVKFTETKDYKLAIGFMSGDLFSSIQHEEQEIALGTTESGAYYPLFHEDKVQIDTNPTHTATYGFNVYTGNDAEGDCIGYIDIGSSDAVGNVIRQAHVVLFDDPLNPIDGQGNIEVTFPHYVYGLAERINKCRFGIVYNNRLFLSGNPEYRSCDWHSGAVNVSQDENYDRNADLDFTYFSDLDYCYYGTDETALVGYDIHRDGDLIAVKQGSRHEATLYRRSYKLVAAQAYDGSQSDSSLAEEAFPMFDINANGGVGGLSNRSILSFVGETLVLTKDGLKAITSKESVSGTEKYSVDVSTYINPKITEEGLENAFIYACKEKMYLKTDRGVYVGYNELRNERGEYEWYFLCDLPATMFFEHDDELYFANDEGEVFRFPGGDPQYVDYDRDYIGYGGAYLTLDDVNNRIITGNAYADLIEEGKIFHLLTDFNVNGADVRTQVHASLGRFVNANHRANMLENGGVYDDTLYNGTFDPTSGVIEIKARNHDGTEDESRTVEIADMFFDGRKVKFDSLSPQNQDSLELYEEYTLSRVGERQYKVIKADGSAASLAGVVSFRMCFVVNDYKFTTIDDVQPYGNDGAKSFTLKGVRSRPLDLVYYNNQNGYYSGIVTTQHKVKSYYVTVPYSMGSISTYKTIWGWVVANDTNRTSFMDIGYITSRKQTGFKTIAKSHQLRFDGLDFSKMTMLNDSLPHVYVQYKTLPAVNFIRFVFKNEEDNNMALTALDVIYTYNGLTKGVR